MTDTNYSAAVNECENCGKPCETLHDLSDGWNFKACDQCAEDAAREDARDGNEWIEKEQELAELAEERRAA